jgi:hypothetical protein
MFDTARQSATMSVVIAAPGRVTMFALTPWLGGGVVLVVQLCLMGSYQLWGAIRLPDWALLTPIAKNVPGLD